MESFIQSKKGTSTTRKLRQHTKHWHMYTRGAFSDWIIRTGDTSSRFVNSHVVFYLSTCIRRSKGSDQYLKKFFLHMILFQQCFSTLLNIIAWLNKVDLISYLIYLNNRVFLSWNYPLIVAPRKLDVLKTNICRRSEASRANMLVLRQSNFPRSNYQTDSSETNTLIVHHYIFFRAPVQKS